VRRTEDQETKWQGVGCHSASQGEASRVEGFAFRDFRIYGLEPKRIFSGEAEN